MLFLPGRDCNLLLLPLETKSEIISYLKPGDVLKLSSTCHVMREILFSTVFHRIVIRPNIDDEVMKRARTCKTRNSLYRILNQDGYIPENILPYARHCVIPLWRTLCSPLQDHAVDALLGAYSNSFLRLNLESLILFCVPLTPSLLSNMRELSHLKSLALQSCEFGHVSVTNVRNVVMALKLEKLEITKASWWGASNKDQNGIIEALFSITGNLVELKHDDHKLAKALASTPIVPPLQVLHIRYKEFKDAVNFICRIPTLVTLSIDEHYRSGLSTFLEHLTDPDLTISLSSFPRLRQLTCPPKFVSALVGSHNLSRLCFFTDGFDVYRLRTSTDVQPVLSQMLSGSDAWFRLDRYRNIQELHIPLTFAFGITAYSSGAGLRQLKKLTIDVYPMITADLISDREWLNSNLARFSTTFAIPSLRHLRFINLPFTRRNLNVNIPVNDLIETYQSHFVRLERFSFWLRERVFWEFKRDLPDGTWASWDSEEGENQESKF
ncbi:hypothetical protein GYMLUDRAFT_74778 [Collybiopsis luxurians FD-317 M1]|uniref:F-box domain-containing protein n=1 Tax=Collybiopsis luxurians FD-317 M1 TaxID=944289 RepID=A0A0D0B5U3_9AGAR|nr:hypothetical protein GYMLUDRAFT_74778 [Collybiopsis luxurians FD-317 M1]